MKEGVPKAQEQDVENFSEWQKLRDVGPKQAEDFLADKQLSHHRESIELLDGEEGLTELMKIVDYVTQADNKFVKQAEHIKQIADPVQQAEAQKVYNQGRFMMRHLGYLRKIALKRIETLELRGIAANEDRAPLSAQG